MVYARGPSDAPVDVGQQQHKNRKDSHKCCWLGNYSPILIFSLSTTLKFGLPSAIVISRKPRARPPPIHQRRFIQKSNWFMVCVCPSFRKAFPFMRNTRGTGRVSARARDEDGMRVRRRRRDKWWWDAARGVSRRAETYVGHAFPNGHRFRPIRLNCGRGRRIVFAFVVRNARGQLWEFNRENGRMVVAEPLGC